MIKAEVIADSKGPFGDRITSLVVTFPRIILSEFNTHRMFSRNSASSRAIPFKTMLRRVTENPFIPIAWQKDHPGMQGTEYFTSEDKVEGTSVNMIEHLNSLWLSAKEAACVEALEMHSRGATKQICNRPLEPYMWHTAIVTATHWDNFWELRCPQYMIGDRVYRSRNEAIWKEKDLSVGLAMNTDLDWLQLNKGQAEIHMMVLAEAIWNAINGSTPKELKPYEWHIPFGDKIDEKKILQTLDKVNSFAAILVKSDDIRKAKLEIATARCARVSYLNYEGTDDYEKDFRLYKQLKDSRHMSPFEHCAQAMDEREYKRWIRGYADWVYFSESEEFAKDYKEQIGWCKNFKGFTQLRHFIEQ